METKTVSDSAKRLFSTYFLELHRIRTRHKIRLQLQASCLSTSDTTQSNITANQKSVWAEPVSLNEMDKNK